MLPLFDMLTKAQNGHGMELLARQFQLTQQQAQLAVEALLPAFSQGLKRNAADPFGLLAFMNAMAAGQYGRYFDEPTRAFSPDGVTAGNAILEQIFGGKAQDLSRAVAAQAAATTGLQQEILRQMMPPIASMIMGGLFKQSTGQMAPGGMGASNPLSEMFQAMMQQSAAMMGVTPAPEPSKAANPFDNPWGKMMREMFGGAGAPPEPQKSSGQPANPFETMAAEFWGAAGKASTTGQSKASAKANPPPPAFDLMAQMFETGRKQSEQYQRQMEAVVDQFMPKPEKNA